MSKIRVKHFGPIREGRLDNDGWIDIRKVTLFLGDQGTGKSTIAKVLATMTWMEKVLVRGDETPESFVQVEKFKELLKYHRLHNYFTPQTELEYVGNGAKIRFVKDQIDIQLVEGDYDLPQVMYVPSERNFISYVEQPELLKLASGALFEFLSEFDKAKRNLDQGWDLPFGDARLERDQEKDYLTVSCGGQQGYKLRLSETSSGYQSSVPLLMVTRSLIESINKKTDAGVLNDLVGDLSPRQFNLLKKRLSELDGFAAFQQSKDEASIGTLAEQFVSLTKKFKRTHLVNVVEEPEQNLYPDSQWKILEKLLSFNNEISSNKLIMTSHSPYLINVLSIAIQVNVLLERLGEGNENNEDSFRERIGRIFQLTAATPTNDVAIYELTRDGRVEALQSVHGIPSDENLLNLGLRKCNEAFDALFEIEDQL